jgi:hypothetical protein
MNEQRKQRFRLKRLINERCHTAFEQRWRQEGLRPDPPAYAEGEKDPTSYDLFLTGLRERAEADRRAIIYGQRRLEESGDVEQDAGGIWRHADGTFATRDLITLMEGNPFVAAIEARIFEKKEGGLASRIENLISNFREQFD